MEEEKKSKRKSKEIIEIDSEEKTSSKPENKKAYKVVLVTVANVVYSCGDGLGNSVTPNVWGMQLQPGDEIYI
jgi:hypothetical protein